MAMAAAIGGGLGALGSIYGARQAKKSAEAAMAQQADFTNKALAALEKVGIPAEEAMQITLETPELVFQYAPELEQQFPDIKSQLENIEIDPRLQEAQTTALSGLSERAEMGLTPEEKAELDNIRRNAMSVGSAQRESALQTMDRRGLGGSGMELISQLEAAQSAQDAAGQASQAEASEIFKAKQAALQNLGAMAGSQRSQQFGEQAKQASAADIISQFNRNQQAGTQQRNIGATNQAELMRQQGLQTQEDTRAAARNAEEKQRIDAKQQRFGNEMAQAGAAVSAYTGAGTAAAKSGATAAANQLAMGEGFGKIGSGIANIAGNIDWGSGSKPAIKSTYDGDDDEYEYRRG
jgi:hypothetical protein